MADIDLTALDNVTNRFADNQAALSAAVDGVSIRFDALKALISTGMTAAQVQAVKDKIDTDTTKLDLVVGALDTSTTALNAIGKPADPIPDPPPPVDPAIVTEPPVV